MFNGGLKVQTLEQSTFMWALQSVCALHRKPYSAQLSQQQLAAPYTVASMLGALTVFGFDVTLKRIRPEKLRNESFPLLIWLPGQQGGFPAPELADPNDGKGFQAEVKPALILQADPVNVLIVEPGDANPRMLAMAEFEQCYLGHVVRIVPRTDPVSDPDSDAQYREARRFGFSWFVPELLKHKKLWQEVLLASLVIQLIGLATPLFTQTIIDKVIVHRTHSTLVVIALGMVVFTVFSAALSWLRQYLVLHTGNRVDAVLGASVFERLFKLPPAYFQHRPTGVIAARLHGVETIREFVAGAAVTLLLDCPFLLIFVAVMLYYSVTLTLVVLAFLALIVLMSLVVAPMFQARLQEQFLFGARNQAFVTEYVAGIDTVKSLQFEPQLGSRYGAQLAAYLSASFATKQLGNTYNTAANALEQSMNLLVLALGAYTVMQSAQFTIGMLVAFQMFSSRLSQPMLRLVGLWQQFQQSKIAVERLGDLMNAPTEPYSVTPSRDSKSRGAVRIDNIAFKYAEHLPLVYENLSLTIEPGQVVGIMGPSGCGKSTLAKLLQGFFQPSAGAITVDGVDIRYLSANELRSQFGVVPQETVLFSGTIYDNLQMASPNASFEQIVAACQMAEIHDLIQSLPLGYQTEIGERGAGLSGGQKQRIAIARALLKRPSILVFDEATSALDGPTAEQFAQTINTLRGRVTMLFITHGLPKGLHVDAIYRLGKQGAQRVALAPAPAPDGTARPGVMRSHVSLQKEQS